MTRSSFIAIFVLTLSLSAPSQTFSSEAASQESSQQGQHSAAIEYLLSAAATQGGSEGEAISRQSVGAEGGPDVVGKKCCKVCRKGKACGDGCIARDKQCHKGPGCACDG